MTNRERIKDNYEDALFAVWMDDFARRLGAKYAEENERLNNTPEAAVPQALQRKNLEIIFRALRRDAHTFTLKSIGRVAVRFLAAALILAALFGCAYAAFEPFRVGTLNLLMDLDEKVASFQLGRNESETNAFPINAFPIIEVKWLPDGYNQCVPEQNHMRTTINCINTVNDLILVHVLTESQTFYNIDVENADYCEEIIVQGFPALLVDKDGMLRISWADETSGTYIYVASDAIDKTTLVQVAENLSIAW